MSNPLEQLLQERGIHASHFSATSRYYGQEIKVMDTEKQGKVAYVTRRFIPHPNNFETLQEHTVIEGDRLDNIAHQYLGDPEQFWRICDANAAMHPNELTDTPGKTIRITLPEGISGQ